MKVLWVRNVEDAFREGIYYLYQNGVEEDSRVGKVLVAPCPVTTVYSHPQERVLFNPIRDANPFFHLFEALWMLAGRNDARWLDQFVKDFSTRFAEEDGRMHGAYGFRWRDHFDLEGGGSLYLPDQLATVVRMLKNNPQDRQAVITMWDPVADLGRPGLKDRPCNTHCYLRIRQKADFKPDAGVFDKAVLDLTVLCRSNDIIWGAYGANAVHFSVLQEYLAACIGVGIGTYYQVSNNYHAYKAILDKLEEKHILESGSNSWYGPTCQTTSIVTYPESFDEELSRFFEYPSGSTPEKPYRNTFFERIAIPLFRANNRWRWGQRDKALEELLWMPLHADWRLAAEAWFKRRMTATAAKEAVR